MPDLIEVLKNKWKQIAVFTLAAAIIALVFALLSKPYFLSVVTALPANSVVADKARIYNQHIESLYSDFGTPDELDRIEGSAHLDTLYLALAVQHQLWQHYGFDATDKGIYAAAQHLKKNTSVSKSAYGELKIKVWDHDAQMAALLANDFTDKLQALHQTLQNEGNVRALSMIREDYQRRQQLLTPDSLPKSATSGLIKNALALQEMDEEQRLMDQYEIAIHTNAPALIIVEKARPSLKADKPDVPEIVLLSAFAAFVFSYLLALAGYKK